MLLTVFLFLNRTETLTSAMFLKKKYIWVKTFCADVSCADILKVPCHEERSGISILSNRVIKWTGANMYLINDVSMKLELIG